MMATATLFIHTITEGMGTMALPTSIMAIIHTIALIRTDTIGEVRVLDVQGADHLTLAQAARRDGHKDPIHMLRI